MPLDLEDLDRLLVKLQGKSTRRPRSVARVRDTAIVGLLAAGLPATRIFALRTGDLPTLRLPRPAWVLLGMWAWRRAYVLRADAEPMAFVASDGRPLQKLCLRQLVTRRARAAGIQRLVLPSEIQLGAPWSHLPSEAAPPWFAPMLRGVRMVHRRVRLNLSWHGQEQVALARAERGLPPFGTSVTVARAWRLLDAMLKRTWNVGGW